MYFLIVETDHADSFGDPLIGLVAIVERFQRTSLVERMHVGAVHVLDQRQRHRIGVAQIVAE